MENDIPNKQSNFVRKLKTIVLENYTDEQFGVSDLVERIGISRSQLHRKLKSATGQSISQFIREIRLDEALKLLQQNDLTASEVAYKVGFNSPTYFNTCFNEYFGYPPGESQLQMELAKSNNYSEVRAVSEENKFTKNKRVVSWLFTITMAVLALFIYKYVTYEETTLVEPSEEIEKSIAVLPLKNWSGDVDLEFVSDGITDAIISKLANIEQINRVTPFTSVEKYKDTQLSIPEIAQQLGVAYILEGNFKLSGDQIQSNLNLIEVSTNEHLWRFEYSGIWKSDDIFGMQAAVAENVAEKMRVNITVEEKKVINLKPTDDEKAYRAYLRAEFNYEKLSLTGFENAELLFKKAIALDSSFIEPYIGLAVINYISGCVWGGQPQEIAKKQGDKFLKMAEQLNQDRQDAYKERLVRAQIFADLYYNWDFGAGKENINYLVSKKNKGVSNNEIAMIFEFSRKMGEFERALEFIQIGIKANSVNAGFYASLAFVYYLNDETSQALATLEENDPIYKDDFFYLMESSKIYYYLGDYEKSEIQLKQFKKIVPTGPPQTLWLGAVLGEISGDEVEVQKNMSALKASFEKRTAGSPAWFLAMYYSHIREYDMAFEWLEKSYEHREVEMTWLKEEPLLRPLRSDPRYIDLYDKVGFSKFWPIQPFEN